MIQTQNETNQSGSAQAVMRDPRWQQVLDRNGQADGQFFYAVKTTGVYCRPSCGARQPRPENVAFYATAAEAASAGFRPCKRCKPEQLPLSKVHADKVALACRLLETAEVMPTLTQLAAHAGLSTYHFHRVFKSITGLTPKAYASAHRAQAIREKLAHSPSVTQAIYAAGYASNSRFYETANHTLGMQARQYLKGGIHTTIRFALAECSLGSILVASSDKGICAISIGDDAEHLLSELQDRFPNANLIGGDAAFESLVASVIAFVESPRLGLDLPLDIQGTAFQQRVWLALREIPAGSTVTYTELAQRIGMPNAVRAVASACAANTLAVMIPCHRVVRLNGALSGYRWGVQRKQALIERESET
ncbi:MAG: bifunctional DNA-binding transcriptional regulator/O6-methylguanine-DNA methyltransferase Ada [Methylophilus sp.]|uniref:bifunctional DNA-binding transcriptional regulator/O6-methylguanine-DNA methyltransferase Ada n=1 Tax=Methylophilus sp. TaxID=29541 RepID=UPI003FA0AF8D